MGPELRTQHTQETERNSQRSSRVWGQVVEIGKVRWRGRVGKGEQLKKDV